MKKLIFTLIGIALFLTGICQDTKPTVTTFKQLQSPQFWFNSADTSVWMYKGNVYGWTQLQRTSKKYSIWNHTGITNSGWVDGKVLKFDAAGNLVVGTDLTGTGGGIALTDLSAGGSGLSYNNTTGQFYITSGYSVPTTAQKNNFLTAYGWGDHAGLYAPLSHVGATGAAHGNATASVAGFMTAADYTKLGTIASYADNYGSWNIDAGTPTSVNSGNTVRLLAGANIGISQSGRDITLSAPMGSMVYPGAGIALSNGSGWSTSITNNSANWNTAYANMGKVTFSSGYGGYYQLSPGAFSTSGSDILVSTASTATSGNYLPITSNAAYDALLLKANLSGAAFTGAITGTTATFTGLVKGSEVERGSSRHLKYDIKRFTGSATEMLKGIEIDTYKLKADSSFGIGFIAEDTHEWLSGKDHKSHLIGNHVGLLTKAIQEQNARIEKLEYALFVLIITVIFLFIFNLKTRLK